MNFEIDFFFQIRQKSVNFIACDKTAQRTAKAYFQKYFTLPQYRIVLELCTYKEKYAFIKVCEDSKK